MAAKLQNDLVERHSPDTATFENIVLPPGHDENARLHFCQQVEFLANVTPDGSLRAACREASKRFRHFVTSTAQPADLYMLVAAINDKKEVLTAKRREYFDQVLSHFEDPRGRMEAKEKCSLELIEAELSQVKEDYLQTYRQESGIWLTQDELEGIEFELLRENYQSEDGSRLRFSFQKMVEEYHDFDAGEISQYFEMSGTIQRTLGIFESVFGIMFAQLDDQNVDFLTNREGRQALTWHPDVLVFAVWDAPQCDVGEQPFLGYLYMDLFCRPGKRPGFSDLPISPGFTAEKGNRVYPSTCLLCDFDKPKENSRRFLQHQEVVVLFHELGHGIHDLVAKTEFARFHGASTAEDFNEAPSQMLEHWCWHPEILKSLGQLHTAQDEVHDQENVTNRQERSMADPLIEKLLHSRKIKDAVKILGMLSTLGMGHPGVSCPAQACMPEHITVEGLYKYLITQIYASDMFSTVFEQDPRDGNAGSRYRRTILDNGSSRDEM
ncbi:hypothetical protein KC330_g4429 [Hortaea werneckii]|nr:hypothetical protein KC330_g4429 [Hortaea werneckii]